MSLIYSATCPDCGKELIFDRNEEWVCYNCDYDIGGEKDD